MTPLEESMMNLVHAHPEVSGLDFLKAALHIIDSYYDDLTPEAALGEAIKAELAGTTYE